MRRLLLGDQSFLRRDDCFKPGERGGARRGIEAYFGTCNKLVQGTQAGKRLGLFTELAEQVLFVGIFRKIGVGKPRDDALRCCSFPFARLRYP
ncbi:hypothetical protein [Bradyrhizobium sp. STM 3562]|uniref:hypothetical protein n=1 Tax=Bradyrhizobium sp. STM 3562 TaxID=578924 RepID=UPI00388D6791